jgi:nitrate reductase gamma subunit
MTSGRVQQGGTWTFTEPFHWTVWVALGGTALIISLVVAVVEHFTFGAKSNRKGETAAGPPAGCNTLT